MQANEEAGNHHKSGGDEDAINFRPSSNFKYMKKYCKGKVEARGAPRGSEEAARPGAVRPPLPRGPPPPDSPPLVTPKQELEEEEYAVAAAGAAAGAAEPTDEGKERIMCRQFARGACTRGAACIYAHEIILSQLPGIYTFCRDYQNSTCSFPRCKFVHATVFEKEYFYRTGFLPPHALKHLKEGAAPALPPTEGGRAEAPVPALFPGGAPAAPAALLLPGVACAAGAEARPAGDAAAGALAAPLLVDGVSVGAGAGGYRDMDDPGAAAARDPRGEPPAAAAPPAPAPPPPHALAPAAAAAPAPQPQPQPQPPLVPRAKCSNCDLVEFRRQCQRNKADKLARSVQELDKKLALLNKKSAKQLAVLLALLRHSGAAKPGANMFNDVSVRNDKEKAIMDKLNVIFSANGGQPSALEEHSNKGLSTALVRLLLGAEDAAPAPADS